jgi:hypothetical protein
MDQYLPSPLDDRLAQALQRATRDLASAPDARRRVDQRVRVRRRKRVIGRVAAVAAVALVAAGGLAVRRSGAVVTSGTDPDAPVTAPAPSTVPRVTATDLPEGYRYYRLGDGRNPVRLSMWASNATWRTRPVQPGPADLLVRQVFQPKDLRFPGAGAVILRTVRPGDIESLGDARPVNVGLVAGQMTGHGRHLTVLFDDGDRSVLAGAFGVDETSLLRFLGALRWDAATGRYVALLGSPELVESYHDSQPFDATVVQSRSRVCRPDPGAHCYEIGLWNGHTGYDAQTVPIMQQGPENASVDVNGRQAFVDTDGQLRSIRWISAAGDLVTVYDPDMSGSRDELIRVARGLRPTDEVTWQALPTYDGTPPPAGPPATGPH